MFTYKDRDYPLYQVPIDGTTKSLALVKKGLQSSQFADPAAGPSGPLITWQGSWRTLQPAYVFDPHFENFTNVWDEIHYPRLLFNTIVIALLGMIGTVVSCTLVAYGFARFRFPGRNTLFLLVIATIFLPGAVTIIPTYTLFSKIGWTGTWLPLIVPAFFANAYDVFLLRQYLLTIPREMDEAAAIDGAGPFRTLISVIIPQAWPVITAVAIFHLVYSWNDFFGPLIYLSGHDDLQTVAVGLANFSGARIAQDPGPDHGRHAHDPDHPGPAVHRVPARVRARHRHHRGREVAMAGGPPGVRPLVRRGWPPRSPRARTSSPAS